MNVFENAEGEREREGIIFLFLICVLRLFDKINCFHFISFLFCNLTIELHYPGCFGNTEINVLNVIKILYTHTSEFHKKQEGNLGTKCFHDQTAVATSPPLKNILDKT